MKIYYITALFTLVSLSLSFGQINVTPVPDTTINEDQSIVLNLLNYFSSTTGSPLTFEQIGTRPELAASISVDTLTITPAANWNGQGSFFITARDSADNNITDNFELTVKSINDAPYFTASLPNVAVHRNRVLRLDLQSYVDDADDPSGALLIKCECPPGIMCVSNGFSLDITPDGRIIPFPVSVFITDGKDSSDAASFSVDPNGPVDFSYEFPLYPEYDTTRPGLTSKIPDEQGGIINFNVYGDSLRIEFIDSDAALSRKSSSIYKEWIDSVTALSTFKLKDEYFLFFLIGERALNSETYHLTRLNDSCKLVSDTVINLFNVNAIKPDSQNGLIYISHSLNKTVSEPKIIYHEVYDNSDGSLTRITLLDSTALSSSRAFNNTYMITPEGCLACWIQQTTDTIQNQSIFCQAITPEGTLSGDTKKLEIYYNVYPDLPQNSIVKFRINREEDRYVVIWIQHDFKSNPDGGGTRKKPEMLIAALGLDLNVIGDIHLIPTNGTYFGFNLAAFIPLANGYFIAWTTKSMAINAIPNYWQTVYGRSLTAISNLGNIEGGPFPTFFKVYGDTLLKVIQDTAMFVNFDTRDNITRFIPFPHQAGNLPDIALGFTTDNIIRISNVSDVYGKLFLYDYKGKCVFQNTVAPGFSAFSPPLHSAGNYLIKLSMGGKNLFKVIFTSNK